MRVIIVTPEKQPYISEIDGSLESMQKTVGGMIQAVYPFNDDIAIVCNEEGKFMDLPTNRYLANGDFKDNIYDVITGTFFLCGVGDEDFMDFPKDHDEKYIKKFSKLVVNTAD